MSTLELLRSVYHWLPIVFAADLVLFHVVADHPLALRRWWGREERVHSLGAV